MKYHFWILLLYFLSSANVFAQSPMDKGFKMLETGQFSDAAIFFKNYLKTDSTNQTALLCYGRGIGLSGKTDEAKEVFKKLQSRFPNNYEIDLNMAEAQMWSRDFSKALDLYAGLVKRDSTNFAALLGYANAFSENKKYTEALSYVEKALKISPNNANAMVSRKYMRLGKASVLANDGKFDEAIRLYNLILAENAKDEDALINKAQTFMAAERFIDAKAVFEKLASIESKKVEGLLGLSQVANRMKNNDLALLLAKKAVEVADSTQKLKAQMGLVNALGWKKDFVAAFKLLEKLNVVYPNNLDVISGFGRINIWSKGFAKGASYYKLLLNKMPSSFDGNLGFADAHHAQGLDDVAYKYVRNTLHYYPNQRDALLFLERLHVAHDPSLSIHSYFSKDNGGNISQNYKAKITFDPHALVRTSLSYYQRTAQNEKDILANSLTIRQIQVGASYRLSGTTKVFGELGIVMAAKYQRFIREIGTELRLGKYQLVELKYYNELQNFTASLIERNLQMNHLQANYNLSLPSKFGVYSQLIHTNISDHNQRNLVFASVYYDFKQSPVFKAGVNLSVFSFKKQVPEVYFSPTVFKGIEIFSAAENFNELKAKWLYQATVAGGFQKIGIENPQVIYRFDIKTGWRFSKRLWAMLYFMRSNSAASSVQGFTYNEWGLKAHYIFPTRLL